jgi:hypothetical protein
MLGGCQFRKMYENLYPTKLDVVEKNIKTVSFMKKTKRCSYDIDFKNI